MLYYALPGHLDDLIEPGTHVDWTDDQSDIGYFWKSRRASSDNLRRHSNEGCGELFRSCGGKVQTCATVEFQLKRNLRNPTFRRNTRSDWETKFANDLDQLGARAWHGRNRLLLDSTELMVEHPEVRQGIFGFEELMQAGAMEAGFVEAAAEVGSMSPGSIDHLDLDKRDLDFGGSYACNKRCQGAYPYDEGTRKTLISQKCRKSQNF